MWKEADHNGANHSGHGLFVMLGGVAIGTAVGLLTAPQSGQRTWRQIRRKVEDLKDQAVDLRDGVVNKVEEMRKSTARQMDMSRKYVGKRTNALFASLSGLQKPLKSLRRTLGRG